MPRIVARCTHNVHLKPIRPIQSTDTFSTTSPVASEITHGSPNTEQEVNAARSHCLELVGQFDYPSRVLMHFLPSHTRDAHLAIRALNIEVSRVADTTTSSTVGMMRMQFWRDTVSKALAGTPPKEPVAVLLTHAARILHHASEGKSRFSKPWLHRLITTREQHLGNPPYPTLSSLETYAENTYSTLLYLTLSAIPQASLTTDHIASHIGKAMGIVAVLRGIPLLAFPQPSPANSSGFAPHVHTQGAVMIPLDVMAEAGLKEEDVFRYAATAPGLRDAIFNVATRANDHLITAREMLSKLRSEGNLGHEFEHQHDHHYDSQQLNANSDTQLSEVNQAFGVFTSSVSTQMWLDRLEKADFDIFDPSLRKRDWTFPWRAYWANRQRQI